MSRNFCRQVMLITIAKKNNINTKKLNLSQKLNQGISFPTQFITGIPDV